MLRTQNLCPRHKNCFQFLSETFCVRNNCFSVCSPKKTSWATICPPQCVLVFHCLYSPGQTRIRVDESWHSWELSSTLIDNHQLGLNENESPSKSHRLSRKIWAPLKPMRAHESRWECMRVPCQTRARVWTLINSHPRLARA